MSLSKVMTSVWGPLGWMTLHSASSCYPDSPTPTEVTLMSTWLDMFQSTITCPSCKEHFGTALAGYRQNFPTFLASRRDFMMFAFRVHNSVNNRLHKPVYLTIEDCFRVLRENVKGRSAREYRIAYLNHIRRFWKTLQDTSGLTSLKKINEMTKIEVSYFQTHDNNFEVIIPEDTTFLPPVSLTSEHRVVAMRQQPRVGLVGGRFRLR